MLTSVSVLLCQPLSSNSRTTAMSTGQSPARGSPSAASPAMRTAYHWPVRARTRWTWTHSSSGSRPVAASTLGS
jgi:hypothetical protein